MFVGRSKEIQDLNNYYKNHKNQIMILYGQPGIGKKTLLKHFLEGKQYYYYKAVSCSTVQQRKFFAGYMTDMGFSFSGLPDYEELFEKIGKKEVLKKIIVIDEFHHIWKNDPDFLKSIESYSAESTDKSKLSFILISSLVSFVENIRQDENDQSLLKNIVYLKVPELSYPDFLNYFQGFSKEESVVAYSILGGIPGLWNYFDKEQSLKENICNNILQQGKPLLDLGQRAVSEELRETAVYNTILACLAGGNEKLNQLYQLTGFSRAKISVYLKNLMQPDIVEKIISLETRGREYTKKGIYRISHPYVNFYYRYLFGRESILASMGKEEFCENIIFSDFGFLVKNGFRSVCMEFIEKENRLGRLPGNFTYQGQWIGKKGNIDFIYEDLEEGEVLAGMCSPKREVMTIEEYHCFLECEKLSEIHADLIILFSCQGFDNYLKDAAKKNPRLALVTLEQMRF